LFGLIDTGKEGNRRFPVSLLFLLCGFSIYRKAVSLNRANGSETEQVLRASAAAAKPNSPYREWLPFLEALFIAQAASKKNLGIACPRFPEQLVRSKWEAGFPLLRRWEFPVDIQAAEALLRKMHDYIPEGNSLLQEAHEALLQSLSTHPGEKREIWDSFLQHEMEPWEAWVEAPASHAAALLFWGRSCLRPSLEWTAAKLLDEFPLTEDWRRGYCPVCGSLPSILFLNREGERRARCSWCATPWGLNRLQCPYCDNRYQESLGYFLAEDDPYYRVQYCRLCKMYFKLIDPRERLDEPYLPLEEWTTLHLDMLAQREGWRQPPSPSPQVYGTPDQDRE
jgi:FdhE protein